MDKSFQLNMAIGKTDPAENAQTGSYTDSRTPSDWTLYFRGAVLLILVGALYFHVLLNLFRQWFADPNYSHGIFVPLFSALLCWNRRQTWTQNPARPSYYGLVLILGALGMLVVGTLGAELFLTRISFIVLLGGLAAYFTGWQMLDALLAPWLVLFLMVPIPVIVFNEIAFPLQLIASRIASSFLELLQVPVLREGNVIVLPSMSLDVVEACSGIRSLMSLITLAVFYGVLAERRHWMRWLLVVLSVPVALAANATRIVGAALFGQYMGPQFAEGFFHAFSGWLIFALALGLLIVFHKVGSRLMRRRATT